MCLAQGPQRSDASEALTHGPSVSSQALYHWATALLIAHMRRLVWAFAGRIYHIVENLKVPLNYLLNKSSHPLL